MALDWEGGGGFIDWCCSRRDGWVFFLRDKVPREGIGMHTLREHYLLRLVALGVFSAEEEEGEDQEDESEC